MRNLSLLFWIADVALLYYVFSSYHPSTDDSNHGKPLLPSHSSTRDVVTGSTEPTSESKSSNSGISSPSPSSFRMEGNKEVDEQLLTLPLGGGHATTEGSVGSQDSAQYDGVIFDDVQCGVPHPLTAEEKQREEDTRDNAEGENLESVTSAWKGETEVSPSSFTKDGEDVQQQKADEEEARSNTDEDSEKKTDAELKKSPALLLLEVEQKRDFVENFGEELQEKEKDDDDDDDDKNVEQKHKHDNIPQEDHDNDIHNDSFHWIQTLKQEYQLLLDAFQTEITKNDSAWHKKWGSCFCLNHHDNVHGDGEGVDEGNTTTSSDAEAIQENKEKKTEKNKKSSDHPQSRNTPKKEKREGGFLDFFLFRYIIWALLSVLAVYWCQKRFLYQDSEVRLLMFVDNRHVDDEGNGREEQTEGTESPTKNYRGCQPEKEKYFKEPQPRRHKAVQQWLALGETQQRKQEREEMERLKEAIEYVRLQKEKHYRQQH